MRKALKFALAVCVAACFSMPLTLLAQNQMTGGSLSGRSVNVAGSGMSGERVELLRGTDVVSTTTTNGLGEWSFRGVEPGVTQPGDAVLDEDRRLARRFSGGGEQAVKIQTGGHRPPRGSDRLLERIDEVGLFPAEHVAIGRAAAFREDH